ncbi:tetratricopeptide repeat-containing glycosyltransferase family protein [Acidiphilium sp. PA]|uniref:tetratricopeptide repeat-containing glycosyltransferase family protein n=1 Tax=Acidiphilium sp. PA TaxID=2871705 RepID=UPI00224423C3|nr:tetratricopeptide repeat-containing glycosyltransferase family protein [Acidiphilium sp. PA]MCW8306532.1 tetratricopeptide repeat-containing glycosyltransferase family protein [Acidiphilium sp. PA]
MSGAAGVKVTLGEVLNEISAYEREGKLEAAEALAERVLRAAPEHPHVLHLSGIVAYRRGKVPLAIERMEKSLALSPTVAVYPRNMCEIYRGAGRLDDALRMALRAVELAPEDKSAHFNHALIRYERRELDDALAAADRAIELDPDFPEAHFERAEVLLLGGRLTEGWDSYEWRFKLKQAEGMLPKTDKPQWDGGTLPDGKLLIVADQGFGDCIQFGRYIPWAAERAPKPVLACSGDLVPIMRQIPGLGRIVTRWETTGDFDAYIPLSGLPRLAGTTIDTIPTPIPYLHPDPHKITAWKQRLDALTPAGKKRIGLVWAGRPTHKNDRKRTVKLEQFAPLFTRADLAIVTVQKGDQIAQVGNYFGTAPLINLGPSINDFTDTLAILQSLDHLVTIDTSVAHLAGASGVPTAIILPYAPDWRWLLNRDDSPWYPSLRLYRQQRPYDWSGVIERIAAAL